MLCYFGVKEHRRRDTWRWDDVTLLWFFILCGTRWRRQHELERKLFCTHRNTFYV